MQSNDRDTKCCQEHDKQLGSGGIPQWNINTDVLSTKGLPLSGTLRVFQEHKCSCPAGTNHKSLFDFNASIGADLFLGKIPNLPLIKVCWNSLSLFEDVLPRKLTGLKSRKRFENLETAGSAVSVLFKGTYWCHRTFKGDHQSLLRLYKLLSGSSGTMKEMADMPLSEKGLGHFRQLLSTADGLLIQIMLGFPDCPDIQCWEYFDNALSSLIKHLLVDWTSKKPDRLTYYEAIKSIRGQIKQFGFHESNELAKIRIPREMTFLRKPLSYIRGKTYINAFRVALLVQTRACGTPPLPVIHRSFSKFRETVTLPSQIPPRDHAALIAQSTKLVFERIAISTNLRKEVSHALHKAKISLSDSAELNTKKSEGGMYEAYRKYYDSIKGTDVPYVNLVDGSDHTDLVEETLENIGTRVFHSLLGKLKSGDIPDLMTVRVHGVLEPGKVRQITVADMSHSVLLHPISHVLLDILKLVPSSASGVGAAHHAFNFYKRLCHKNPCANFIFDSEDTWIMSSDLETATDYANPYIVQIMLQVFLGNHCLGVPPFYRKLVIALLSESRLIYNLTTGESFKSTRGCFMGDPVTKFVMHLLHLVGKEISLKLFKV